MDGWAGLCRVGGHLVDVAEVVGTAVNSIGRPCASAMCTSQPDGLLARNRVRLLAVSSLLDRSRNCAVQTRGTFVTGLVPTRTGSRHFEHSVGGGRGCGPLGGGGWWRLGLPKNC